MAGGPLPPIRGSNIGHLRTVEVIIIDNRNHIQNLHSLTSSSFFYFYFCISSQQQQQQTTRDFKLKKKKRPIRLSIRWALLLSSFTPEAKWPEAAIYRNQWPPFTPRLLARGACFLARPVYPEALGPRRVVLGAPSIATNGDRLPRGSWPAACGSWRAIYRLKLKTPTNYLFIFFFFFRQEKWQACWSSGKITKATITIKKNGKQKETMEKHIFVSTSAWQRCRVSNSLAVDLLSWFDLPPPLPPKINRFSFSSRSGSS